MHNGHLTCASATAHYGLWLRSPPTRLHLACNHGHGTGFIRHRTVRFDGHPALPVAAVEDVTLHALGCLAPPSSTAMATSAIRPHGVPIELLKDQPRGDRSAPVRRALRELDLRAESIVEIDGFAFHSKRADMLRDRHRNNTSAVQGFAVLRYMPEHIWFNPEQVVAEIRAVLAARSGSAA